MEKEFKTYEQMVINKLKEIEPTTQKQWALAMEHSVKSFWNVIKKLKKLNLVIVNKTKQPYTYTTNKEKIKNE